MGGLWVLALFIGLVRVDFTAPSRHLMLGVPAQERAEAESTCPSVLGLGVATKRTFCDVLTGQDPKRGVLVDIPPHRGAATLSFDLHNRHTYSEDQVRAGVGYAGYTATIGILTMDGEVLTRGVVRNEFRDAEDLLDRVAGGAGPSGVKAVAPVGAERVLVTVPANVTQVSILGESLIVLRRDAKDVFTSPGRPIAIVSNVEVEFQPARRR